MSERLALGHGRSHSQIGYKRQNLMGGGQATYCGAIAGKPHKIGTVFAVGELFQASFFQEVFAKLPNQREKPGTDEGDYLQQETGPVPAQRGLRAGAP